MSKKKLPKPRNPMARELAKGLYHPRIVDSAKSYSRKSKNKREHDRYYSECDY